MAQRPSFWQAIKSIFLRRLAFLSRLSNTTVMSLPRSFTTVTPLSKALALILFALLPIIAFFFGMSYQQMVDGTEPAIRIPIFREEQKACTMEAKLCPDGSAVGRSGPNCEFAPCPTSSPSMLIPSQQFHNKEDYTCPQEEWINCMPGFGPADSRCAPEFLQWAKTSCPDFKGAAY